MTPQEQQLLEDLLSRLGSAGALAKDPQADGLIRQRLAGQPDAAYLLVQRTLLLEQALAAAHARIAQLQQAAPATSGSFLGQGLASSPPPIPAEPPAASAPGWRERWFGGAASPPPPVPAAPARGSSFLGTAASTAAGVAGGMFLFQGVENLLGGHHGGLFGGDSSSQPTVVENITNNTYYDDAPSQDFADGGFDAGLDDNDWT